MSTNTYFKKGSWNATCDVCGFDFKAQELKQRWDGLRVCKEDWEARHPLDFQRVKPEKPTIPWSRPNDSEGELPTATSIGDEVIAITANTQTLHYLYNRPAAIGIPVVRIPAANSSAYQHGVILSITIIKDSLCGIRIGVLNTDSNMIGLTGKTPVTSLTKAGLTYIGVIANDNVSESGVSADTHSNSVTYKFRNDYVNNIWYREA